MKKFLSGFFVFLGSLAFATPSFAEVNSDSSNSTSVKNGERIRKVWKEVDAVMDHADHLTNQAFDQMDRTMERRLSAIDGNFNRVMQRISKKVSRSLGKAQQFFERNKKFFQENPSQTTFSVSWQSGPLWTEGSAPAQYQTKDSQDLDSIRDARNADAQQKRWAILLGVDAYARKALSLLSGKALDPESFSNRFERARLANAVIKVIQDVYHPHAQNAFLSTANVDDLKDLLRVQNQSQIQTSQDIVDFVHASDSGQKLAQFWHEEVRNASAKESEDIQDMHLKTTVTPVLAGGTAFAAAKLLMDSGAPGWVSDHLPSWNVRNTSLSSASKFVGDWAASLKDNVAQIIPQVANVTVGQVTNTVIESVKPLADGLSSYVSPLVLIPAAIATGVWWWLNKRDKSAHQERIRAQSLQVFDTVLRPKDTTHHGSIRRHYRRKEWSF